MSFSPCLKTDFHSLRNAFRRCYAPAEGKEKFKDAFCKKMKKYIRSILTFCALTLASALLLPSCAALFPQKNEEPTYIEELRLEIEEVQAEYTSDEINNISLTLQETVSDLLSRNDGYVTDGDDREKIRKNIEEHFIPLLLESDVSYSRFMSLMERINEIIESEESDFDIEDYTDIYLLSMSTLGRERSGRLLYLTSILFLEKKAEQCLERYEEYGYEWYLEDREKYLKMASDIENVLGEYEFCDAVGLVFFTVSLLNGTQIIPTDSDALYLDSAELLALLQNQADMLVDHRMSAEQWTVVLSFIFEFWFSDAEPRDGWSDVQKEEFLALRNCPDYAIRLGKVMPYVTNLYATAIYKLDKNKLSVIVSDDRDAAYFEVLRVISLCEREFGVLAHSFEMLQDFRSEDEAKAIEKAGAAEDFAKYSKYRRQVKSTELFTMLRGCVLGQNERDELRRSFENFMYTNAPYFTYAFIYKRK